MKPEADDWEPVGMALPPAPEPDWRKLAAHFANMKYYAISRAEQLQRIENANDTILSATSNLEGIVEDMAVSQAEINRLMAGAE